jgi:hypothetical protein
VRDAQSCSWQQQRLLLVVHSHAGCLGAGEGRCALMCAQGRRRHPYTTTWLGCGWGVLSERRPSCMPAEDTGGGSSGGRLTWLGLTQKQAFYCNGVVDYLHQGCGYSCEHRGSWPCACAAYGWVRVSVWAMGSVLASAPWAAPRGILTRAARRAAASMQACVGLSCAFVLLELVLPVGNAAGDMLEVMRQLLWGHLRRVVGWCTCLQQGRQGLGWYRWVLLGR